jgi:tRNA 5-methylaminomethyl-2-thiouridine biosynthesis bifunctional protein
MKRIAIIGAGLAGTAAAYVLNQRGLEPVIYEAGKEIAHGASGNEIGLYNPRLSAERSIFADSFDLALKTFLKLEDIGWHQWGSLHLVMDEKKQKRFTEAVKNWGWNDMRMVNASRASIIAGVEITKDCLWLPRSGVVSPRKLCAAYAKGIEIHFDTEINALSDVKADAIIVANGMGVKNFSETQQIELRAVRGQITYVENIPGVKCNLCYGGYVTPKMDGMHAVGSTFQRWLDHTEIMDRDDEDNIGKLAKAVPALAKDYKITGHRAAVRMATPDHMPVYGPVKSHIYMSAGHGSHGIVTSLWAAHRIADDIIDSA